MPPSNLQGLNIVHNVPPPNPYLSDADLLSVPPFSDLNAQLDLWTNLNFQSDEPLVSNRASDASKKDKFDGKQRIQDDNSSEEDSERYNDADDDMQRSGIAETHSHENVVMGTVLPPTGVVHAVHPHPSSDNSPSQAPPFDINSLLAGFGIDPFMVPHAPLPQSPNTANTIAQLLSLHATSNLRPTVNTSQSRPPHPPPINTSAPTSPVSPSSPAAAAATTTKRTRTARGSISSTTETPQQSESPEDSPSGNPLNAAEDKRRRNTAASARFRLKKKEREAALERKAKELELRVGELEKECEALRRENGWLKGLVVGVTGAGAVQQQQLQQQQPTSVTPPSSDSAGLKRPREEDV